MKFIAMLFFFIVLSEMSQAIVQRLYGDGLGAYISVLRHGIKPAGLIMLLYGMWRVVLFPYDCAALCVGLYFYRLCICTPHPSQTAGYNAV